MTWLFEQPLAIVAIGVLMLIALGAAWSATGRRELLQALVIALVLMVVALIVERLVVTDREAIEATVLQIAHDVESNNHRAVVSHVNSGFPSLKQKAEAELPHYRFTECRVTKIHEVYVSPNSTPRMATVDFNIIASGSFQEGGLELSDAKIPRWVRLYMTCEKDGRWTVTAYEHDNPERFMMKE